MPNAQASTFSVHRQLRDVYPGGLVKDKWEWAPAPALRPYILCYWVSTSHGQALPPYVFHVLPDGCVDWVLPLRSKGSCRGGTIAGMMTRPLVLQSAGVHCTIAVRFRPGGAHAMLGESMDLLAERVAPAEALLGSDAIRLEDRLAEAEPWSLRLQLLEREMNERLRRARGIDPVVPAALREWIWGSSGGDNFVRRLGIGERQLRRICNRWIGIGPTRLKRVLRFMRATESIHRGGTTLASVAALTGYTDQAHMIHEFRELSGLSPQQFGPRRPVGCPLFTIQSPSHLLTSVPCQSNCLT